MEFTSFKKSLTNSSRLSANSVNAYISDTADFARFLEDKDVANPKDASKADISAFLLQLKESGKSAATLNRKLAAIRAYYRFLEETKAIEQNPANGIKSPRITRNEIEYLTLEETDKLLTAPDESDLGLRDMALLETLYATGMRVTELMFIDVDDVNLRMGFITCDGSHGKARIVPFGRPARAALERYIYDVRPHFRRGSKKKKDAKALFLNYYGERITRQALWKILRAYASKAGINKKITPQILRNSFAVHMLQNGADLKSLQELMGHEDPAATQAYLAVSKNRIKDVYDRAHPRAQ